jgi:hypothetical protein
LVVDGSCRARAVLMSVALVLAVVGHAQEPLKPAAHDHDPPPARDEVKPAPEPGPAKDAEAKAVATLLDGSAVPKEWPLGKPLILSARKSVCGARPRSVEWHITPAWLEGQSVQTENRRTLTAATGTLPKTITIRLTVYKADTGDSIDVPVKLVPNPGELPRPPPGPDPVDPDRPDPPPGPVDPDDVTANGAAWGKELLQSWADSFKVAQADVLAGTKPVDQIQKEHQERWRTSRNALFDARFAPIFDKLIPPAQETEPTVEQKRRFADAMGRIIAGVLGRPAPAATPATRDPAHIKTAPDGADVRDRLGEILDPARRDQP